MSSTQFSVGRCQGYYATKMADKLMSCDEGSGASNTSASSLTGGPIAGKLCQIFVKHTDIF